MFKFEKLFERADVVERHLSAPLLPSRLAYLARRSQQGTKRYTLRMIARAQLAILRYLELEEDGKIPLAAVVAAAERWAAEDPTRRGGDDAAASRRLASRGADWLRFAGRLECPSPPQPHSDCIAEFVAYMRQERGFSEATIRSFRCRVEEFVRRFRSDEFTLADVTIGMIDQALGQPHARTGKCRSRITVRGHAHALRAFFRYAEDRGWCRPGLAGMIATPRIYTHATLPAGPTWEDVQHLLEATDGDRPADLRARAILLLLSVYGLRAGDVSQLSLDDIDWKAETIRVRRSKTGNTNLFPLSRRVAAAIARYLREARPHSASRALFLTLNAPVGPVRRTAISSSVFRLMRRTGTDCKRHGSHALRHAFAQRLLDKGFSMTEIGDCLGHRSPVATAIYAKVNLAGLREVADFDLGELL